MLDVAVLGAGPTGMFAAQAAERYGHMVTVYSKAGRKSFMNGAQYLHKPIPGLSEQAFEITYDLIGSASGYRAKVYGADSAVAVSVESLLGKATAWDVRAAYDHAWAIRGDAVVPWDAYDGIPEADVVISTIPRHALCHNVRHTFDREEVWATNRVLYPDQLPPALDDMVICSGRSVDNWYRQSRIRGHENTEWPLSIFKHENALRTGDRLWQVVKPIGTDCDCNPGVHHVGRYGEWKKGVLAHSGYYDTAQILTDLARVR